MSSVFFGGGTPTVLPPADLGKILAAVGAEFGFERGVEVTAEANPETVDERSLSALRAQGINRMSFGMQSAAGHVLEVLDRGTHQAVPPHASRGRGPPGSPA